MKDYEKLINLAREAMEKAHAPYSKFKVGAALLTKRGKIYTGCNVENVSHSPTNCAERTAIFKAVSEGEKEFKAIAIISNSPKPTAPCGSCRQVLYEFGEHIKVIMTNLNGKILKKSINELLPFAFDAEDVGGKNGNRD